MATITKIRTMGTLEDYNPQGTHLNTLYQVEDTDTILYNGKHLTNEDVEESIEELRKEVPNVVSEKVVDETDFPQLTVLTRADLKKDLFDDLWIAAVGTFGKIDHTHYEDGVLKPYYLNELWLTYEEAIAVYNAGPLNSIISDFKYAHMAIKTNLPALKRFPASGTSSKKVWCSNLITDSDIEVLNLSIRSSHYNFPFANLLYSDSYVNCKCIDSKKLRKIIGPICVSLQTDTQHNNYVFGSCPLLESMQVSVLSKDLIISGLPKLDSTSVKYMFTNRTGTNTISVTFHADVYNKIIANEGEWNGILDLATSKNITLASA